MTDSWPEYWRSDPSDPADPDSVAEWIAVNRPEGDEIRRALHALCEHASEHGRRERAAGVLAVAPGNRQRAVLAVRGLAHRLCR